MMRFRVTWAFGGRSASYIIVTTTLAIAREAATRYRLPGIEIVSVEPDDGDDGAGVPATLSPKPPLRSHSERAALPPPESA
jgi:hypothetical protein